MGWLLICLLSLTLSGTEPMTIGKETTWMGDPAAHASSPEDHLASRANEQRGTVWGQRVTGGQTHEAVVITPSADAYGEGDLIAGTITNGGDQPIWTEDLKSDCSVAILERQDGTIWQPQLYCNSERLPMAVTVPSRGSLAVTVNPRSTHFMVPPGAPPAVGPGTYRLSLTYRLTPGPEGDEPYRAVSAPFTIGSVTSTGATSPPSGVGSATLTPIVPEISPWWQFAAGAALLGWWTRRIRHRG